MERIRLYTLRQSERNTSLFHPKSVLFTVCILLIGFTLVGLGVEALGQTAPPRPNPFAAFADIFPGEPQSAVDARAFICTRGLYDYLPNQHCSLDTAAGAFTQVGVVVADGVIDEISFRLRDDTLQVGDLMLLWGIPEVVAQRHAVYLYWHERHVIALVRDYSGEFSLFLRVRRVTINGGMGLAT